MMEEYKNIERSIITKYRKDIWSKFVKAVKEYELINENDNIMVCISGGKDSFLMAKCIEELIKHGDFPFKARYVCMNPGYNKENVELIKENAKRLNIDLEIFESDIFEVLERVAKDNPCYLCAKMRRGCLYSKAKELGCNKIALAHHFNDVIETNLLNMFYASQVKSMLPKLHSDNFEGLELIRPMYLVKEEAIKSWAKYNELRFLNCACKFTLDSKIDENLSKRKVMKHLVEELKKENKNIDENIFTAFTNVNTDCLISYIKDGKEYSFLDEYDNKE
jgi:tRNA(Ile)-lysidine synthase TilS/MesJ